VKRVAITGLGCVSAAGLGVGALLDALRSGRSAIAPVQALKARGIANAIGAEVRGFDPAQHFDPDRLPLLDRFAQFALIAAREALAGAGLETSVLRRDTAVILGSGVGGKQSDDEASERLYSGDGRVHPLVIPRTMMSAATSHVTMEFGMTGPAFTVTSACSSSAHALGQAMLMIRSGMVPVALAGGSDAAFCYGLYKAWAAMRLLAPDTCRPFDRNRRGLVLGEGAGILVLEDLDHAQARGAAIHAELAGFGMTSDADHITQPSADGEAQAMVRALQDGGIATHEIEYINAHGTGTPMNDRIETTAIKMVFDQHAQRLPVSSTKSILGHALGAAGALECVACVLAMEHRFVPPTANYVTADPECDLDCVPNLMRPMEIGAALSNSFAFGGLNAVIALKRWDG
jgi:nodulation protein E